MTAATGSTGAPTGLRRLSWLDLPVLVFALAVVLPFTAFAVGTWLAGFRLQPVLSGSMEPSFPLGSLLVVQPIDPGAVDPGMAVTFEDPMVAGRMVTHRVVRETPGEELAFVTRGDANATEDPIPVPARSIRGHVLWSVPGLGFPIDWLTWPRGFVALVVLPATLLGGLELRELLRRRGSLVSPTI